MNVLQQTKFVAVIPPVAIKDNASWTEVEIDCKDYDWLTVIVALGVTDIAMVALKMQETDATGSGEADITGLIWGTSADIAGATSTLPSADDDGKIFVFEVDLRKRKRFLSLVATAGDGSAGTFLSAVGILSRGDKTPVTAAERGCIQILRV
jgi:hypothetical protein